MRVTVRTALLCTALLFPLAACGGGGGGSSGGGNPPQLAVVDVVVRGTGMIPSVPQIHMYFDVLASPLLVPEPDVRISPAPTGISVMGCTGAELVLAQDLGELIQNVVFIYDDTDLTQPVVTPSVTIPIPSPTGATHNTLHDMVVLDGDLYVLSSYFASGSNTRWAITHVFRDIATLSNGSTPDAIVTHTSFVSTGLISGVYGLAVDDAVLIAAAFGEIHVSADPGTLAGSEVPDQSVDQATLSVKTTSYVALGGGDLYLYRGQEIVAFDDPVNLADNQLPLFTLGGPSTVLPIPNGVVEVEARLFSLGLFHLGAPAVVGFDVDTPPSDFLPPDVSIGVPVVGEQRIDGGPGALVCGQVETGVVSVFENPGSISSGAQPDLFLYDPTLTKLEEVRVARP